MNLSMLSEIIIEVSSGPHDSLTLLFYTRDLLVTNTGTNVISGGKDQYEPNYPATPTIIFPNSICALRRE